MSTPFASRLWYVSNPIFWVIYDVSTMAYGNMIIHLSVFISTIVALIRVDDILGIKKRKKQKLAEKEQGNAPLTEEKEEPICE